MKQYDIGIDLGTTSIIIATEEQGVVFRQPTIGAVDTRTNSILAVGDEALKMVGRAPAHIDLVRPLRDGIIQDHRMTRPLPAYRSGYRVKCRVHPHLLHTYSGYRLSQPVRYLILPTCGLTAD